MSSWITQPNKSKCIIVDVKYLAISSVTLAATGKEKILHISCPTFTIKPEYLFMYVLDTHILLQLMFLSLWLIQRRETKKHMHYLSSVYSTRACWIPKFVNLPTSQFMRWMKQRGIKVAGIVLAYNSIYQFEVSMQIWLCYRIKHSWLCSDLVWVMSSTMNSQWHSLFCQIHTCWRRCGKSWMKWLR